MAHLTHPSSLHSAAPVARDAAGRSHRQTFAPWPDELLTAFSLRMSSRGMSISRVAMQSDARYALQQLRDARHMGDATLALLADELFRCFEAHQSGLSDRRH